MIGRRETAVKKTTAEVSSRDAYIAEQSTHSALHSTIPRAVSTLNWSDIGHNYAECGEQNPRTARASKATASYPEYRYVQSHIEMLLNTTIY